jgi:hypothetical protein
MFDNPETTNKIYVEFCGGLGNRMWQLAAAIVAAIQYDANIYVNKSAIINHQNKSADYFENIFQNIGIDYTENPPNHLYYTYHIPFMISTEKYSIENLHFPIRFNQYYQYYPVIQPFESQIRSIFLTNLETHRNRILANYPNIHMNAFIHVRHGDYVNFKRHPIQPIEYYQYCVTDLTTKLNKNSKILVFSDDINWIREHPFFNEPSADKPIFEIIETDEIETMAYMSLCRGGAICANSTFSWWGAFLGAHQTRSPVYVPRNWMLECQIDGLFPDEWIQI